MREQARMVENQLLLSISKEQYSFRLPVCHLCPFSGDYIGKFASYRHIGFPIRRWKPFDMDSLPDNMQ
jgi:hypothetical protein